MSPPPPSYLPSFFRDTYLCSDGISSLLPVFNFFLNVIHLAFTLKPLLCFSKAGDWATIQLCLLWLACFPCCWFALQVGTGFSPKQDPISIIHSAPHGSTICCCLLFLPRIQSRIETNLGKSSLCRTHECQEQLSKLRALVSVLWWEPVEGAKTFQWVDTEPSPWKLDWLLLPPGIDGV